MQSVLKADLKYEILGTGHECQADYGVEVIHDDRCAACKVNHGDASTLR